MIKRYFASTEFSRYVVDDDDDDDDANEDVPRCAVCVPWSSDNPESDLIIMFTSHIIITKKNHKNTGYRGRSSGE